MLARAPRSAIEGPFLPERRSRRGTIGMRPRSGLKIAAGAGIACGLAVLALFARDIANAPAYLDRLAQGLGLSISTIDVRGNRYTQRADIVAALAISPDTTHLALDIEAAQHRIEALPWVSKARIHRDLPGGIAIEITERRAAIVWRQADRDTLIDATGRSLASFPSGSDLGLPVIEGDNAGPAAADLFALLAQSPETARRTLRSRRIEARRWTLDLAGGIEVHLPAEGLAGAIAWLESQANAGLLDVAVTAIDLRVPGQLVVRLPEGAVTSDLYSPPRTARAAPAAGGAP